MDYTWIILEDDRSRIGELSAAIKKNNSEANIHLLWMTNDASNTNRGTDFDELISTLTSSTSVIGNKIETLPNHSDTSILLLDLNWGNAGKFDDFSVENQETIRAWLEQDPMRIIVIHSSGYNADTVKNSIRHSRCFAFTGATDDACQVVAHALNMAAIAFGPDYSGITFIAEKLIQIRHQASPGSNHDPVTHWQILEQLLSITDDDRESFYNTYWPKNGNFYPPPFIDGDAQNADPVYSGIKELHGDTMAVSVIAAFLFIWGGMRNRLKKVASANVQELDAAMCEQLNKFRKEIPKGDKFYRYDYLAGFEKEEHMVRCMKLLYRAGFDLVWDGSKQESGRALQLLGPRLSKDLLEFSFRVKSSSIFGQFKHVVDPLCSALEGSNGPKIPTSNKSTIRALVSLNAVLGTGGDSHLASRKFCHYYRYLDDGSFRIGFMRMPSVAP
jgi:hypothetical protein